MGLAHRGFELFDYGHHLVHTLREAGYWSGLIGEQHLSRDPAVIVRLGRRDAAVLPGRARVVEAGSDEDELARRLVAGKYQPGYGGDLSGWRRSALPVAVDLAAPAD